MLGEEIWVEVEHIPKYSAEQAALARTNTKNMRKSVKILSDNGDELALPDEQVDVLQDYKVANRPRLAGHALILLVLLLLVVLFVLAGRKPPRKVTFSNRNSIFIRFGSSLYFVLKKCFLAYSDVLYD